MVPVPGRGTVRGAALPSALLFMALGLALSSAPRKVWIFNIALLSLTATAISLVPIPNRFMDAAFTGCWLSVMACAAIVHLRSRPDFRRSLILSLNAGLWSGCMVGVSGSSRDLLRALPCVLIALPAAWMVAR